MVLVEVIVASVGVLAGLSSLVWNVIQIRQSRSKLHCAQSAAACKIQRAYRRHRAKVTLGGLTFEVESEPVSDLP